MKISAAVLVASFLALDASAVGARDISYQISREGHGLKSRQQGNFRGGFGKGGGFGGFKGGKGGASAASTGSAASSTDTSTVAAAASSTSVSVDTASAATASVATAATSTAATGTATTSTAATGNGAGGAAAASSASVASVAAASSASAAATASAAAATSTLPPATQNNPNLQDSLTLDTALIGSNLGLDGQAVAEAGQVPSLTSRNNFINFCAGTGQPVTNGLQQTGGSCNPVPMGQIPASTAMPSCKFTNPANGATIPANTNFTISMAVSNMDTGNFVNAATNYYAAPQQLNAQGLIIAHSHVVVESLSSLGQTTPTNPQKFAFFKGLNAAAVGGILSAEVAGGLPAGAYKVSSINAAANHQPVLAPIAQHGSMDDVSYFTVQ